MTKGFRSKRRVSGKKEKAIVSSLASGQAETGLLPTEWVVFGHFIELEAYK